MISIPGPDLALFRQREKIARERSSMTTLRTIFPHGGVYVTTMTEQKYLIIHTGSENPYTLYGNEYHLVKDTLLDHIRFNPGGHECGNFIAEIGNGKMFFTAYSTDFELLQEYFVTDRSILHRGPFTPLTMWGNYKIVD